MVIMMDAKRETVAKFMCAICGDRCRWIDDTGWKSFDGGWYCDKCKEFTSHGIEAAEDE